MARHMALTVAKILFAQIVMEKEGFDMTEIIKLADHRPPVVYTISVEHHWDGRVVAYAVDVSDDTRSKEIVWDTLVQLVMDYRDCGELAPKSAKYERAKIVAWLRSEQFSTEKLRDEMNRHTAGWRFADEHASALEQSAAAIERGEHLQGSI